MLDVRTVTEFDAAHAFNDIQALEREHLPRHLHSDAEQLRSLVTWDEAINLTSFNSAGKPVGYLIALPLNALWRELKRVDRALQPDGSAMYLESIVFNPEENTWPNVTSVVQRLCFDAAAAGYGSVDMHANRAQGFSDEMQNRFAALKLRTVEDFGGAGSAFDLIRIRLAA